MKYLYIYFKNGETYRVPAEVIAKVRAEYYEAYDGTPFQTEFDYAMRDDFEIIDWAGNNMDWEDLEPHAERVVVRLWGKDYTSAELEIKEEE